MTNNEEETCDMCGEIIDIDYINKINVDDYMLCDCAYIRALKRIDELEQQIEAMGK